MEKNPADTSLAGKPPAENFPARKSRAGRNPFRLIWPFLRGFWVFKMNLSLGLCLNPDLHPERRFVATVFAQVMGSVFLLITGIIFFFGWLVGTSREQKLLIGIGYIFAVALFALFVGFVGGMKAYWPVRTSGEFQNEDIDRMLALYLFFDIPLITILVCLQGGLTKSVLFPFFFFIPVAHRLVERPENEGWILRSHLAIAVCMLLTFIVSLVLTVDDKLYVSGSRYITIPDLTTLSKSYAIAILLISFISLGIPILMEYIKCTWPKTIEARSKAAA